MPETRTLENPNARKLPCDQNVVDQPLDRIKGERCPVPISLVDSKFTSGACTTQTGDDDKGRRGFQQITNQFVGHADILLLPLLEPVAHGGCFGGQRTGIRRVPPSHPNKATM